MAWMRASACVKYRVRIDLSVSLLCPLAKTGLANCGGGESGPSSLPGDVQVKRFHVVVSPQIEAVDL